MQLEVTMADQPCQLCPPFLWNTGMVMHVLNNDPPLKDLDHVQVDSPGMSYLFFYDRLRHCGLTWEAAQTVCSHLVDTFSEWIGWSMIGTLNRNYHCPALIVIFIFPDLLPKILRPSSQERACPTRTYACLVKHNSK